MDDLKTTAPDADTNAKDAVYAEPSPADETDYRTIRNNRLWQEAMGNYIGITLHTTKVKNEDTDEYRACQAAENACWTALVSIIDLHCRYRMIEAVTGKILPRF